MAREMKDSGIEWIGEIPVDWNIKRNKLLFVEVNNRCENGNEHMLLSVSEYYGVAPKSEKVSDGEFETRAESLDGYKLCEAEDIVMNIMLAWKRSTGRSAYDGIVSPAYCVYRKKADIDTRYYHYLFRTDIVAELFKRYSTGIIDSRLRLYPDKFMGLNMIVPPCNEQCQIAEYLDQQCVYIDSVIEKTKVSIDEYIKLKQAIITWAVTKGVRGDREMKDSGLEGIGEIPIEWHVKKIRYLGGCQNGISKSSEYFGEGYPFVSYGDVYRNYQLPETVKGLIMSTDSDRENYSVIRGDVLFTRTSETIEEVGFSSVCLKTIEHATFAGFVIRFRPNSNELLPEYSKYYFRSDMHRRFFVKEMNLVTRASLGQDLLKKLPVILPPLQEQQEIANYLEKQCGEIDGIIDCL